MPDPEELIDDSIEGRHARRDDLPRGDNPHALGTCSHRFWKWGWDEEDKRLTKKDGDQ